jgi:hypothetical protein
VPTSSRLADSTALTSKGAGVGTVAVVIRTFGTDGTDVARALSAWAAGAHPAVPGVPSLGAGSRLQPRASLISDATHAFGLRAACVGTAVDPEATWRVAYADDGSVSVLPEGSAGGRAPLGEAAAVAAMEARGAAAPTAMVCADHYKWCAE